METNYAVCVEARRSIIDKTGKRYTESVIETNAMAILAIAERNAILKVIPKSIIDRVYDEAFKCAFGDLSDAAKFLKERDRIINVFKTKYEMQEDDLIRCLGLKTKEAIRLEHIANMNGYLQALKDKELTVEELLKRNAPAKKDVNVKKTEIKNGQNTAPTLL